MYSKRAAVQHLLCLGDMLGEEADSKNLSQMVVGSGELKRLLSPGSRRGKSTLSLALKKFAAATVFNTSKWCIEILDPDKPIILYRKR